MAAVLYPILYTFLLCAIFLVVIPKSIRINTPLEVQNLTVFRINREILLSSLGSQKTYLFRARVRFLFLPVAANIFSRCNPICITEGMVGNSIH
jgi:hypothetical protein